MQRVKSACKEPTLLKELWGFVDHLHSDELEAALLETGDNLADEASLDAVGLEGGGYMRVSVDPRDVRRATYLDHDEATLLLGHSEGLRVMEGVGE